LHLNRYWYKFDEIEKGYAAMKKLILSICLIGICSILYTQTHYLSIVDKNGDHTNTLLDSVKDMTFIMNQTHALRTIHRDGSQIETIITDIKNLTFTTGSQLEITDRQTETAAKTFILRQNYPNPFNPSTTIEYELPQAGWVKIQIFNISGQLVRTLFSEYRFSGGHQVIWNGENDHMQPVSSGVYLYRMYYGNTMQIKKLLLVR
jgi:hypothetical protein